MVRRWKLHLATRPGQCALTAMTVPLAGSDLRGHSFGTKAFIQGPPPSATTTPGSRQAVYWGDLRREVDKLRLQRAPDLSSLCSLFSAHGPGLCMGKPGHRALCTECADVLLFSFGLDSRSAAVHVDLQKQNDQWCDNQPGTFEPYFVNADGVVSGD